ncbi:MAG: dihydroneopterin aldolase, partial [Methylophaga sp.]
RFDLEFDWDIRQAANSDDIKDTLDYGSVAGRVVDFVSASRFQLIETLAEKVAALLLSEFPVHHLKLTLSKPVRLHGQNQAQIQIERTRS